MAADRITYADKDKTLGTTDPRRLFRDTDANEIKNVINSHADLLDNMGEGIYSATITSSSFTANRKLTVEFPEDSNPDLTLDCEGVKNRTWYLLFTSSLVPLIDFLGFTNWVEGGKYTIYIVKGYSDDMELRLDDSLEGDVAFRDSNDSGATAGGFVFTGTTGSRFALEITVSQGTGIVEYMTEEIGWFTRTEKEAIDDHMGNTSNPHSVTKSQVGLGNVDNTSDANKPVSTAQQTAIDTAFAGVASRIAPPVSDLAALKSINTTNATTWPDKIIILAEAIGQYRLDRDSSATGDDDGVVQPTTGVGRWIKMNVSSTASFSTITGNATDNSSLSAALGDKVNVIARQDTGTTNAIVFSTEFDNTYTGGESWTIVPAQTNTGAATINRDGGGAKDLKLFGGADLPAGLVVANKPIQVVYNGTYYILVITEEYLVNDSLSWSPTVTGFSVTPTATYLYTVKGKEVTIYVYGSSPGTSNATTYTITLPFTSKDTGVVIRGVFGYAVNNTSIEGIAHYRLASNTNVLQLFFNAPNGTWTSSGTKGITGSMTFLID